MPLLCRRVGPGVWLVAVGPRSAVPSPWTSAPVWLHSEGAWTEPGCRPCLPEGGRIWGDCGEGAKGRRPAAEQSGAPAGCGHHGEGGGRLLSMVVSGHGQVWLKGCRSGGRSSLAVFDLAKVGGGEYRTRGWGWPDSVTWAWFPSSWVGGWAHIRGTGTEGHCRVTLGCSYARPAPDWQPC